MTTFIYVTEEISQDTKHSEKLRTSNTKTTQSETQRVSHHFSLNCSLAPYWLLGFHHLSDIVYCPHSSHHDPINYETEHVISSQKLLPPFISLRALWPSRLHIVWPLANLFDFIFCLTFLLKVHPIYPGLLHLENTNHASTHILCLWSSSKRLSVWLTRFNQVSPGMFIFSDIFVTPCPAYTQSHPLLCHSLSPSTCFLSCFFVCCFICHHWTYDIIYYLLSSTRMWALWYQRNFPLFVVIPQPLNQYLALGRS